MESRVKIGEDAINKYWLEGFPTPTTMNAEMILRSKIHYLYSYPKFERMYHGEYDKIPIKVVEDCFTLEYGYQAAMDYIDNLPWILITKEPKL